MSNTYPTEIWIKWKAACINTTTSTWNAGTRSGYGSIYIVQLCCHICLKGFKLSNTHIDTYQVIIYQQGSCNQKQNISFLTLAFTLPQAIFFINKAAAMEKTRHFKSFLTFAFILLRPLFYQQNSCNVQYEIFKLSRTCIYSSQAIILSAKQLQYKIRDIEAF